MKKLKVWLSAARLRTLPLSLSGIITGTSMANFEGYYNSIIFTFCLLVTIGFQVTSNFANDYGDGIKGTDSEDRIGPKRALQSGMLTPKELKSGIIITAVISLVFALFLIIHVFDNDEVFFVLLFMGLAASSIWASIKYTVGNSAYGYHGFGDVFVFLFFGLLGVMGTKFLYVKAITTLDVLPALGIGLLCVGVLNLNNLRDVVSDKNHGKNTVVVKLGFERGKRYHAVLLLLSFASFVGYLVLQFSAWMLIFLLPYLFIFMHLSTVLKTKEPVLLDPELKKLALATFFLSISFYVAINYFL